MGALLTRLYGIDQNTPYGFKFSGITLWLLAADAGVQRVIDDFNPNCPRWLAHSTLQSRRVHWPALAQAPQPTPFWRY